MNALRKLLCIPLMLLTLQALAQQNEAYLRRHAVPVDADSLMDNKMLDSDFYAHQLFLVGEIHGIQKGQDIDYTFLTVLNRRRKVKTYVAEIDFAKAYFLNEYLKTGDERLIDAVFKDWVEQDAQWANIDFQQKIRKIRLYNQSIKKGSGIHFEGIDQIQNPSLVADYLQVMLKAKPVYLKEADALIKALQLKNDSLIVQQAGLLLQKWEHSLKRGNTDDDNLRFALGNCIAISSPREIQLFNNFKKLFAMRNWKDEPLYGFFGFAHVLGAKANNGRSTSFAYMLAHDEALRLNGKIAAVGLLYVDSKMMTPNRSLPAAWQQKGTRFTAIGQYNHDGPLVKLQDIESFKGASVPGSVTLFDLAASDSPYLNTALAITYAAMMPASQRLLLNAAGAKITDYLKYVLLVRNSEGTQPIKP